VFQIIDIAYFYDAGQSDIERFYIENIVRTSQVGKYLYE